MDLELKFESSKTISEKIDYINRQKENDQSYDNYKNLLKEILVLEKISEQENMIQYKGCVKEEKLTI